MAINEGHDTTKSIQCRIGEAFFTLPFFQPLLHFEWFYQVRFGCSNVGAPGSVQSTSPRKFSTRNELRRTILRKNYAKERIRKDTTWEFPPPRARVITPQGAPKLGRMTMDSNCGALNNQANRGRQPAVNGVSQDLSDCWTQELLAPVISGVVWTVAM